MSSWVAPSVAADIWGISVDQVLAGIADGSIHSFVDGQFLFVDIRGMGLSAEPSESTPTQTKVTEEEFAALTFQPIAELPISSSNSSSDSHLSEEEPSGQEEQTNGRDVSTWRTARQQSSRLRRPPRADAA
jgi:hypothetical protein